jgi:hypothetical protein
MKTILLIVCCLTTFQSFAQLPETVIYLFELQRTPKGFKIQPPKLISKTSGYNNQP